MFELHNTFDTGHSLCLWTVLAIIVFIIMIIIAAVHVFNQKRRNDQNESKRNGSAQAETPQSAGR